MSHGVAVERPRCLPSRGAPSEGGQSPSDTDRALLSGAGSGKWATTDAIRQFQPSWRVRECGRWAAWGRANVELRQTDDGWTYGHLHRCGSVWTCPACAAQIASERIWEVAEAVGWWRARRKGNEVCMLSLTVRHTSGDDLKALRRGVSEAWRRVQQSRPWRLMRDSIGISHLIRCHDMTWGENGWHPHLHVLLFCGVPSLAQDYEHDLTALWRAQVVAVLGAKHLPSKRRALKLDVCHDASYVGRLGLEVSSPAAKHARDGHMAPMQVAAELAAATGPHRERLAGAWRIYALAMHGCHQLQWSRGLRLALGEVPSDSQIVGNDVGIPRPIIAEIPQETWRAMALKRGVTALDELGRQCARRKVEESRAALLAWFGEMEEVACTWEPQRGTVRLRWLL